MKHKEVNPTRTLNATLARIQIEEEKRVTDKRNQRPKRPVRNWTKTYSEHQEEWDDYEEFHLGR
jgi:hypothetical protein